MSRTSCICIRFRRNFRVHESVKTIHRTPLTQQTYPHTHTTHNTIRCQRTHKHLPHSSVRHTPLARTHTQTRAQNIVSPFTTHHQVEKQVEKELKNSKKVDKKLKKSRKSRKKVERNLTKGRKKSEKTRRENFERVIPKRIIYYLLLARYLSCGTRKK